MEDICFIDAKGSPENLHAPHDDSSSDDDDDGFDLEKFKTLAFKRYGFVLPPSPKKASKKNCNESLKPASSLSPEKDCSKSNYITDKESLQKILEGKMKINNKIGMVSNRDKCVPTYQRPYRSPGQRGGQAAKKGEKAKGHNWHNMAATEMTEEKLRDLEVVKMRQALDPKHFYKRSANSTTPKFFQIGTIVESPVDFFSSRIPKKQRKQTIVDELLADTEFIEYQKKKYKEIQASQVPKYVQRKKQRQKRRMEEQRNSEAQKKSKKKNKKK